MSPAYAQPRAIGRYVLFDEIASGGMATVHYGRMTGPAGFGRTVAIKRLHPQFAGEPDFVSMLIDEARLASRIRHPNVVSILDVVTTGGEMLLVLEYVQGVTLAHLTRKAKDRRVPLPIAVSIISGVLDGLHAAHEARAEDGAPLEIVHRDISPQNILIGSDGVARVTDFGIAKAAGRLQTTRDGQIKGKTAYMAPEQIRAQDVDRRTDVYAASVVLWEMLAGRRLFRADNAAGIMNAILESDIPALATQSPEVPADLAAIVHKGLSPAPQDRFATAREMATALDHALHATTAREVGDWVTATASEILELRARHVADMEASSSEGTSRMIGGVVADVPRKTEPDTEPDTPSTDASLVSDQGPLRRRTSAWVVVALAGVGICGVAALLARARRPEPEPPPVASSPVVAASAVEPAPTASTPIYRASEAASSASPSPVTSASPEPRPAPRRSTHPGAHPRVDCDPPYDIDSSGKRHWKNGC